jgi:hypothetical protein
MTKMEHDKFMLFVFGSFAKTELLEGTPRGKIALQEHPLPYCNVEPSLAQGKQTWDIGRKFHGTRR